MVRSLFEQCVSKPKLIRGIFGVRRPEAYELLLPKVKAPVYVLGPYVTGSGGCDSIQPYELIPELIKKYATMGHVVFEGIIVTSVYGQVGTLMEQWKKQSVFLFLDTPLEVCLARVEARRGGKGRDERLIKNVTGKYNSALRVKERVLADGIMRAEVASSSNAHKTIIKLLQGS